MGVKLCSDDISICHRLPVNNMSTQIERRSSRWQRPTNPAIIVKFVRRKERKEFYRARNVLREKTVNDLNLDFKTVERMFITESLTRANKDLFSKALQAKKIITLNTFGPLKGKYIWAKRIHLM